jgi:hypothetical protein
MPFSMRASQRVNEPEHEGLPDRSGMVKYVVRLLLTEFVKRNVRPFPEPL